MLHLMPLKLTFGHRIIRFRLGLAWNSLPANQQLQEKFAVVFIIILQIKLVIVLFILEVDYLVSLIDNFTLLVCCTHPVSFIWLHLIMMGVVYKYQ